MKSGVGTRVGAVPATGGTSPYSTHCGSNVVEDLASRLQFFCLQSAKGLLNRMSSLEGWRQATIYLLEMICQCHRKLWATLSRMGLKGPPHYSRLWRSRRQWQNPQRTHVNCLEEAGQTLFQRMVLKKEGGYLPKSCWRRLLLRLFATGPKDPLKSKHGLFFLDIQAECEDGVEGHFKVQTIFRVKASPEDR